MAKTLVFWWLFRSLTTMKQRIFTRFLARFPVRFPALCWVLAAISPMQASAEMLLKFSANTPTANVLPRGRERAPLQLPDLEYQFRIDAVCRESLSPVSLSLAVADTRRSFNAEQIDDGALRDVRLVIPAAQIAPVVVANFCVTESDAGNAIPAAPSSLTVHAALSAQASLLCAGDEDRSMKYASASLDVLLVCYQSSEESEESTAQQNLTEL